MESRDATFFENVSYERYDSIARISSNIIPESSTSSDYSEQPHEQPHEKVLEKDDNGAPKWNKR